MSYSIVPEGQRFRVSLNGVLLPARFHRPEQAEDYIRQQTEKVERSYTSRKGHLHPELQPNIYAENLLSYPVQA